MKTIILTGASEKDVLLSYKRSRWIHLGRKRRITCALCTAFLEVHCAICSRQLYPSAMITVREFAARTAGSSLCSPILSETS